MFGRFILLNVVNPHKSDSPQLRKVWRRKAAQPCEKVGGKKTFYKLIIKIKNSGFPKKTMLQY